MKSFRKFAKSLKHLFDIPFICFRVLTYTYYTTSQSECQDVNVNNREFLCLPLRIET
jgi:hypothetical protein